jgi:phosphohistidine phosphatase
MKLYLMRHGPAEGASASGKDEDRALTSAGRDRVRRVAKALVEIDEVPVEILVSPLVRAVQTAEIVALSTKLSEREGRVEVREELVPGGHAVTLARRLAAEGRRRVMMVGHEPDMSELALALLAPLERGFDKAMVVGLHLAPDAGAARLRFVLQPKTLRLDPDARTPS